jgi:uncharacterized OsmC-like protein
VTLLWEGKMTSPNIRAALEGLSEKLTAQPEKAKVRQSSATAVLKQGLSCVVKGPNNERIETDMPPAMGGAASGPNPGWYFRASMASCCATVIAMRAAKLGIGLTKLEVTVDGEADNRGMLGLDETVSAGASAMRTSVRISSDNAAPAQLEELVRWAERHSPVGCTVQDAPSNTLSVVVD